MFPANSVDDDDIEIYTDDKRTERLNLVHCLRQQRVFPDGRPNLTLADFVAPKESGVADYIGAFAVTAGFLHLQEVNELARPIVVVDAADFLWVVVDTVLLHPSTIELHRKLRCVDQQCDG